MGLRSHIILGMLFLVLVIKEVETQQISQSDEKIDSNGIKSIYGVNWTYGGKKKFGFVERNIYIGNGTMEQLRFLSNQPFSLIVQEDSFASSFTGFAISKEIYSSKEKEINNSQGVYILERKKITLQNSQNEKSDSKKQQIMYLAKLYLYAVCKTMAISSQSKELDVKITFFPFQNLNHDTHSQINNKDSDQTKRLSIRVGATVYCIQSKSIKQANFFINKLYQTFMVSMVGLILSFRPFRNIPFTLRMIAIIGSIVGSLYINSWYISLICSYCMALLVGFFYRMFQSVSYLSQSRQYILTKSFILVLLASAIPLAFKSHLNNDNLSGHKRILLHIVNLVILCNMLLFTQSLINISRFRHAFYYFIAFLIAELFFFHQFNNIIGFYLINLQAFAAPFECSSLFFPMMLIPLCDYFFKSYSTNYVYKLLIIYIPVISQPYSISCTISFSIGFTIWILFQALKGRDLTKIIRYKR